MSDDVLLDFARLQNQVIQFQGEALRVLYNLAVIRIPKMEDTLLSIRQEVMERMTIMSQGMGEVQEAISLLAQETDNLAVRVDMILAKINNAPTVEEARAAAAQIAQVAGRLRQLAAVPTNAVPGGVVPPDQPLNIELAAA